MQKALKILLNILKWIFIVLISLIIILLTVRYTGRKIYNRTPDGGINEEMYIEVNGQEQWINIYGEDRDNPVMLYLHGGPSCATSFGDWVILRKLAKDYTVVNWDQRDSGKTWIHDPQDKPITSELMRSDIDVVADYVLGHMGKEKLTILGMSWGSMYGADFALRHPEKTECVIELSLVDEITYEKTIVKSLREYSGGSRDFRAIVDEYGYDVFFAVLTDNELSDYKELVRAQNDGMKLSYLEWTENDEKYHKLAEQIDMELRTSWIMDQGDPELTERLAENWEKFEAPVQKKYSDKLKGNESFFDTDVSIIKACFFNPYYSLTDWLHFSYGNEKYNDVTDSLFAELSLEDRTDYEIPFYVLEGNRDEFNIGECQKKYFDSITAPDKEFRYIEGTHMSTMLHSEELAAFVHEIREKQKN
jgi:pimeloyl-ACP methyl ester carboxylesterase